MSIIPDYDLCIIGGGINGAGIARDAAGRGLSVILLEAQDLAAATSSASTKLIHGGLRYLEHYEFRLVREALKEREVLLKLAPHIIKPMEFVLPHDKTLRPKWMIRAGLFLYDHLAGRRKLKKSKTLNLSWHTYGHPLKEGYKTGFTYADCWVDDARLVTLNAMDAANNGATILTRTACTKLTPQDGIWHVDMKDWTTLAEKSFTAGKVINATGPWVRGLLEGSNLTDDKTPNIRLVKGSHIVVPQLFEGKQSYILQQEDRRIVFAIPYEKNFTLIGTTDVDYEGDPAQPAISDEEVDYLCCAINKSFNKQITPDDIVSSYSGVRPLFDDGGEDGKGKAAEVTRDYKLIKNEDTGSTILSVFGGKITTYRKLSEQAIDEISDEKPWTAKKHLPGGDIKNGNMGLFIEEQQQKYEWLPSRLLKRYAKQYGTLMDSVLDKAKNIKDLGEHYGDSLYENEIRYLVKYEWARSSDDILWRKTKCGLHITGNTRHNLDHALPHIIKELTGR